MAKNFPNVGEETGIQNQEGQRVLNKMNPKGHIPGHITIKVVKVKDK